VALQIATLVLHFLGCALGFFFRVSICMNFDVLWRANINQESISRHRGFPHAATISVERES